MVYEPHTKNADLLWACGLCAGFTGIDNYIQKENKGLSADSALPCAVDDTEVCSDAMQIFGGIGYTTETRASRCWQDSRGWQFAGGTNEVMVHIAGRQIIKKYNK